MVPSSLLNPDTAAINSNKVTSKFTLSRVQWMMLDIVLTRIISGQQPMYATQPVYVENRGTGAGAGAATGLCGKSAFLLSHAPFKPSEFV